MVIEMYIVIIRQRVQLEVGNFAAQHFLPDRHRIVRFRVEEVAVLFAVILHETIIEHNVVPHQRAPVGKFVKIRQHVLYIGRAHKIFVVNARQVHDIRRQLFRAGDKRRKFLRHVPALHLHRADFDNPVHLSRRGRAVQPRGFDIEHHKRLRL